MLPTDGTDPASRLLRLLALLQTGRAWPGPDLARRLGISARTLRRDVERLRGLGYTVAGAPGPTTAQALTDRLPRLDGQLQPLTGGRCRYVTHAGDLAWFAATTAALGIPFIIESPPELAHCCRDLARALTHASIPRRPGRDP
ncbi:hypothetical protein BH24ACT12_BH24ACT12_19800 [soil metagenome]